AMHQLQELGLWPRGPQLLDDTVADARSAMHRHARRFVDHQQSTVFQQNVEFAAWHIGVILFLHAHGRNSYLVPYFQPVGLIVPSLAYPSLAATQHAVIMTFRHAFADAQQEIVYSLTGLLGRNINKLDLRQGSVRCRHALLGLLTARK